MTAETDLLPLRNGMEFLPPACQALIRDYARANLAELQREVEGLREYKRISDECNESLRTFVKVEEARTAAAEARAERLAGALRDAREYVASELAAERDKFAGYEHCSNIASIESDLAKIDAALEQEAGRG